MNDFMNSREGKRIIQFSFVAIVLLVVFLAVESLSLLKDLHAPTPVYNTITITGTGESTTTPDIATFSFSVSADAKAVSDAQATVTTKTNAVLAALKDLGIAEKDLQTRDYSVYPKYTFVNTICPVNTACQPSRQIPDGYTVSQTVQVKVRKIDDAGKALAIAGDNGATNISSLSFTLDDPQAPAEEARLKAIDDAKKKAEELADRLGVHLGRVTGYDDNVSQGNPYPVYYALDKAMSAGASTPTIPTGENTTTANVSVTYEIR